MSRIRFDRQAIGALMLAVWLGLFAAGCKKKVPPPPPPPPPAKETPPPPSAARASVTQFDAEPSTIEKGQASTLRWTVTDATDVSISPGIGSVQARGSRQVYPSQTTTYTLTARGPGGTDERTATVTVSVPPPPPPPRPTEAPKRTFSERISSELQDVYYDYDKSDVRDDARATLTRDADALKSIFGESPSGVVVVEGHCDERGSAEYNLGLGDRRATSAREFLTQLGVSGDRLKTVSYGKERPQCTDATEDCYQRNRRVHFSAGQ